MNSLLHPFNKEECSYHYDHPGCVHYVERRIYELLNTYNPYHLRNVVFLCIGTDRATGDCLGPLVGTRLKQLNPSATVYGTLEAPTHATNLVDTLSQLYEKHTDPLVIAVDASLGKMDRIGFINVKTGGLKPGTALKKSLPEVGDFHISGVVNVGGFLDQMVLQNTRLYIVYTMAENIARSLYFAYLRHLHARDQELPDNQSG